MYLMLGAIPLEAINLTEFSETQAANFAEHEVLKGKPRLQAMGENLTEMTFAVRLHYQIGGVESRYQSLLSAKAKQQALALLWGRGKFKGYFVITDLSSTTLFTDARGNVLCRELSVSLKEFVGEMDGGLLGSALQLGSGSILGSILPDGMTEILSDAKAVIKKGVEVYQTTTRAISAVQQAVVAVRNVIYDPLLALAAMPNVITELDGALGGLGELTGLSELFTTAQTGFGAAFEFMQGVATVNSYLNETKMLFNDGFSSDSWGDWFNLGSRAFDEAIYAMDLLAPVVSEMTAWIVLRTDEEVLNG